MLALVFITIIVFTTLIEPRFISIMNIGSIFRQSAFVAVLGIGVTLPMIGGEFDLSTASVAALTAMICAWALYVAELGFWPAVALGLLIGGLFGLFNGIIVSKLRIPALLVTLGSLGIARGGVWIIGEGRTIPITDATFNSIWGTGAVFGIPVLLIWTIVALCIGYITLHKTVFGIHIRSTGSDETSAMFAGVNARIVKLKTLVFAGLLSGFAGLLLAGRMTAGMPNAATGMELDAIVAPILGGVAITGGRGNILCPVVGSFMLTVIANAVVMIGFGAGMQIAARGALVVFAVTIGKRVVK